MRIYVAGRTGLVGKAVSRVLREKGHELVEPDRIDLRDPRAVAGMFNNEAASSIDAVIVAAARVGGIVANSSDPVGFFLDNIRISTNVISEAYRHQVPTLINLGSSCVYPRNAPQPMREEHLLTGAFEPTNVGYAAAKVAALQLTEMYRTKHGVNYISLMPTNLYGQGDRYSLFDSHVIPALIMRFCDAVEKGESDVTLLGSGNPLREFLHVDDLASAIGILVARWGSDIDEFFAQCRIDLDQTGWLNVGSGHEVSIAELADCVADLCGYRGTISFDQRSPDGVPRKLLDSSRIRELGWAPKIKLRDGLAGTIADYLMNRGAR